MEGKLPFFVLLTGIPLLRKCNPPQLVVCVPARPVLGACVTDLLLDHQVRGVLSIGYVIQPTCLDNTSKSA